MTTINNDILGYLLVIGYDYIERGFKNHNDWAQIMFSELDKSYPKIKLNLSLVFDECTRIRDEIYAEQIENLDVEQFIADYIIEDPERTSIFIKDISLGDISEDLFTTSLEKIRQKLLDITRRNNLLNYKESTRSIRVIEEQANDVFKILVTDSKSMEFIPLDEESAHQLHEASKSHALKQTELLEQHPEQSSFEEESSTIVSGSIQDDLIGITHDPQSSDVPIRDKQRDIFLQTNLESAPLERRCKKLGRESRTGIEETGSNFLYLALGFLEWYESPDSAELNRAPLILIPVSIERKKLDRNTNCYTYAVTYTDEDLETNISLGERLDRDFDLILPEYSEDSLPKDYFSLVDSMIKNKGGWRVAEDVVLGLFSFSKILMYKDLDLKRWQEINPLQNNMNLRNVLIGKENGKGSYTGYETEYDMNTDRRANEYPIVLDADSSQHSAIIDVLSEDENIVIEGPPGTGKSQTITNLICAALYEGKSVLFMAEKLAALEVVKSRLDSVGLGDFCLELHSHKSRKSQILKDLKTRIERNYPDSTTLDAQIEDLNRERKKLINYTLKVKEVVGPYGEAIHDIFWAVEKYRGTLINDPIRFFINNPFSLDRDFLNTCTSALNDYAAIVSEIPDSAVGAWKGYCITKLLPGDEEIIFDSLNDIVSLVDNYQVELEVIADKLNANSTLLFSTILSIYNVDINTENILPSSFSSNIAQSYLGGSADHIDKFIALLADYQELLKSSGQSIDTDSIYLNKNYETFLSSSIKLLELEHPELTIDGLSESIKVLSIIINAITEIFKYESLVNRLYLKPPHTLKRYLSLVEINSIFSDVTPVVKNKLTPDLIYSGSESTYKQAHELSMALTQNLLNFSDRFTVDSLPEHDELKVISNAVKNKPPWGIRYLFPNYRKAIGKLKTIITSKSVLKSHDLGETLDELTSLSYEINQFLNDEQRTILLGGLFKGINTDWELLGNVFAINSKLKSTLSTLPATKSFIKNIDSNIDEIMIAGSHIGDCWNLVQENMKGLLSDVVEMERSKEAIQRLSGFKEFLSQHLDIISKFEFNQNTPLSTLHQAVTEYNEAINLKKAIEEEGIYKQCLLSEYNGTNTDIGLLINTKNYVKALINLGIHHQYIIWVIKDTDLSGNLRQLLKHSEITTAFIDSIKLETEKLDGFSDDQPSIIDIESSNITVNNVRDIAQNCINEFKYLGLWSQYNECRDEIKNLNAEYILNSIEIGDIVPEEASDQFLYSVYNSIAREILTNNSELATFSRTKFESGIARFRVLDVEIMEIVCARIASTLSKAPIPAGVGFGRVGEYSELNLIENEIRKKKRHIPIRQLVKRSTKALLKMKPCFMMSPLSVSQYLEPGKVEFDLLIMDEASQIKPEDALGAIARSKQIVVVGDSNQLPPTSFFQRVAGEEYDEDSTAIEQTESILDICSSNYKKRRLRWHYRSEHESLIAFSNHYFYDDDLIVFPSPYRDNEDYGVRYHYIEGGEYRRRRNIVEAQAIAKAIRDKFINDPYTSLGVATINREQRDLVQDELERLVKQEPWLEEKIRQTENTEEPFFIKNLENVQGDERDVIYISTTYGPDPNTGRVFQRFGPITGETGWRRLNVLFSRAKKRVELFSSLKPSDILLTDNSSRGVQALKSYLEYARSGYLPDFGTPTGRGPDSDFEISVIKIIQALGYKADSQVGVAGYYIDIGVKHPFKENEYILGVECDGARYHSEKSIRDRDRLRQEVLEVKGWKIHRIWSTDFFKNREREIERLNKTLGEILQDEKPIVESELQDKKVGVSQELHYPKRTEEVPDEELLRKELILFKEININPSFNDQSNGILRDDCLINFVKYMPTNKNEFFKFLPLSLREATDSRQLQYLDDIFEIIENYKW